MKKIAILSLGAIAISALLILAVYSKAPTSVTFGQGIPETGISCIRIIRKNGEVTPWECSHNVLYNSGKELLETILGDTGSGGPVKIIALCNATAGCGEPQADASETYNEITTCGLAPATGTYSSIGTGNWTITYTFTSTCDNVKTNVTRLKNSGGTYFAGNSFTLATLQNGDQIQVKWYIWVQ